MKTKLCKIASLVLCVAVIAALFCNVNVFATDIAISAKSVSAEIGTKSVSVPIELANNPGVAALAFDVEYDPAVMTLTGVDYGSLFSADDAMTSEDLTAVPYTFVFAKLSNVTGNGTLVTLNFDIASTAVTGSYDVKLSENATAGSPVDNDENELAASYTNGTVTLTEKKAEETTSKTETPTQVTTSASTQNNKYVSLSADSVSIKRGAETVSVPVRITRNPGISALSFDVQYDSSLFTLTGVDYGKVFSSSDATAGDLSRSPYTTVFARLSDTSSEGILMTLNFDVSDDISVGTYSIKLADGEANDIDENEYDVSYSAGSIKVERNKVTYYEDDDEETTQKSGGHSSSRASSGGSGSTKTQKTASSTAVSDSDKKDETDGDASDKAAIKADNKKSEVGVTIGSKRVSKDGSTYDMDVAPYIQKSSNSTLVPLRFVSIAIVGGDLSSPDSVSDISWDAKTKTATVKTSKGSVQFTAGSGVMLVNGKPVQMENGVSAEITDGRMFIPFRALGEAMGVEVDWNAQTKTATYKI